MRKFSPGDIVGVYQSVGSQKGEAVHGESVDGIVYKVHHDEIVISFNEMYDFENFK